MKWNEVKVATASEAVEAVANILMEQGALKTLKAMPMVKC